MPHLESWRPALAALINDELREAYARVVLGEQELDVQVRARLLQSGLIRIQAGEITPEVSGLRALLAADVPRKPLAGLRKYLTVDGAINRYPAQDDERDELLAYIATRLIAAGDVISEGELNDRMAPWDADVTRLREFLLGAGVITLSDDGNSYSR